MPSPQKATALSRNNQLVLDCLTAASGPLSAYDLLDRLRAEGLRAPPQIYRALRWLGEQGLVHKLESANAYIACAHASCCAGAKCESTYTVFLLCDGCGRVEELSEQSLSEDVQRLCEGLGFVPKATNFEVQGTCGACQA